MLHEAFTAHWLTRRDWRWADGKCSRGRRHHYDQPNLEPQQLGGLGCIPRLVGEDFGTRSDLADIFFTTNSVSYSGSTLPGLGLNIVRYNAGGSSSNSINRTTMASNSILPSRKIDGYWIDWTSSSPSSSS